MVSLVRFDRVATVVKQTLEPCQEVRTALPSAAVQSACFSLCCGGGGTDGVELIPQSEEDQQTVLRTSCSSDWCPDAVHVQRQ